MNQVLKKMAFGFLIVLCIAATMFLFLPETCPVRSRIMTVVHPTETQVETSSEPELSAVTETPLVVTVDTVTATDWNTYHGDNSLRGVAKGMLPDSLVVLWSVMAGAPVRQPPVMHNGTIVAVTAHSDLIALKPDGEILWRHKLKAPEAGTENRRDVRIEAPIMVFAGKVVAGSDMGDLVALDITTGKELWWANIGGPVMGTPNYSNDNKKLFVIDQDEGALVCLDAGSGAVKWRSTGADRSDASPAVSADVAAFGSCASALHIIDLASGEHLHDIAIEDGGGQIAGGVALVDGFAYGGVRDGRVVCADITADTFKWITTVSELEVFCTPAVNATWVIVTDYDGRIHGLNRETGEINWQQELSYMPSSPVIVGDKIVVSDDGVLYLLRLEDGKRIWEQQIADDITGPALISGMVIVGTEDGMITALGAQR